MVSSRLLLGVDTGGTYTDAVLMEASTRSVVASGKAITTRGDLVIGVANAVDAVMGSRDPSSVVLVSISTTLATNAVVEGQGSPVLALLVGFDEDMIARSEVGSAFGDVIVEAIAGGHDHTGDELGELDLDRALQLLGHHSDSVEAVAVTSAFAVRNPEHEIRLRELVLARSHLPVTVSTELSDALDAPRRALTTVLNARLLSRITNLVGAVRTSLQRHGIEAPLTIAKGDGSLAVADAVARRPIETILSGPAASMVGAGQLSGLTDFIVSDMGGTTTDVGAVSDGRPRLLEAGARVGGWQTMVRAIDVRTTGLGGDSQVDTDRSTISVGPARHVPLSLLAETWPEVISSLEADLGDHPPREHAGRFVLLPDGASTPVARSAIEARIFERIGPGPARLRDAAPGSVEQRSLRAMSQRGDVLVAGFTPSDAALVLGLQANWSPRGARLGAELMAWYTADDPEGFCRRVWSEAVRRSAIAVLEVALADAIDDSATNPLVDAAASGRGRVGGVTVQLQPRAPIVAVGGPAGVYYPELAARLGADLVLPDAFSVANAVGAAAGKLVASASAEVSLDGPGVYRVIGGERVETFGDPVPAIERAHVIAEQGSTEALVELASGLGRIGPVEVAIDVERHDDPASAGDDGLYLMRVHAEARAVPYATE